MNYGQFLKKLKSYCINRNIKNVDLVNLPIEGLIDFAHLKKEKGSCKGEPLYYEATESSRIVNNKLDINKIRDSLRRFGSEDVVIESFDSFYKDYIDKHLIEDMINDYLDTIETDNCFKKSEINSIKKNTNNPSLFLSMILIKSLKESNLNQNVEKCIIWESGVNQISIIEGDILNYAFGKKTQKEKIVVIPVNTSFDVHVSNRLEANPTPLVSNQTLHGKFLIRAYKGGCKEEDISNKIINSLIADKFIKKNQKSWNLPIGTIATLDMDNSTVFMLAISQFDKMNNAHSSKKDIRASIIKLLEYYNKKGQGYDLFIPLIGTGRSRANLSFQESLDLIISTMLNNKKLIQGRINIVIMHKVIEKIVIATKEDYTNVK